MIYAALLSLSLVVPASIEPGAPWPPHTDDATHLPFAQKQVRIAPIISSATECIAHQVVADPRFRRARTPMEVNDLIVDSVPACVDTVRVMIDAYDRLFGEGAGETFFSGPYLDELPAAVDRLVHGGLE